MEGDDVGSGQKLVEMGDVGHTRLSSSLFIWVWIMGDDCAVEPTREDASLNNMVSSGKITCEICCAYGQHSDLAGTNDTNGLAVQVEAY